MKTETIAIGPIWRVIAVCDGQGRCPTLEAISTSPLGEKMLRLMEKATTVGPANLIAERESKDLGDSLYEFRRRPRSGAHFRVIWFYDKGQVVVCTHAFTKARRKTPPNEIEKAQKVRERYLRERAS